MSLRQKDTLAQLLAKPSPFESDLDRAEIIGNAQGTPFFDEVMASATGTESFEAVLSKIAGPVDPDTIPVFPTVDCLMPEQVYGTISVGDNQQVHVTTCPWCKNMVAAAQPSNEEFDEILGRVKRKADAQRSREAAAY